MSSLLEGNEHLERELAPERLGKPAMGSFVLHGMLLGLMAFYGLLGGLFHHNEWGTAGSGGAINVNLVSNALPLPNEQINNNVLATDTPSQAPEMPTPKAKQTEDENAIDLQGKHAKPKEQMAHQTPQSKVQTQPNYKAQYGEQAGSVMQHAMQTPGNGPATVENGDFGSRFGWYVSAINVKVQQNWYKQEINPQTPRGIRVYLTFTIRRDGSPTNVQIDRSSGSYTLDQSCTRAVQRVDTFGGLPAAYNSNSLSVSYYCEYD
jgi:protein TonB